MVVEGEPSIESEGRRWPRITRGNAAQYEPPSLRTYNTDEKRAKPSPPWRWHWQMTGDEEWDGDVVLYKKQKDRWAGWTGKNAKRVEDRRASDAQRATNIDGHARRVATEAEQAATRRFELPPHFVPHAEAVDARASAMAASLLSAIGDDDLVTFCSMDLGLERRMHEQLKLSPQLWRNKDGRYDCSRLYEVCHHPCMYSQ